MNQTQIRTIILFMFMMICHSPLFSQKEFQRHEFSFHSGYGNMVYGVPGLTLPTHSYDRKLSQGVNWDLQYHFRPLRHFVIGAIYSGFSSKGSHPEGSDHVWVHFIGPQIGVCNVSTERWQMRITGGPGGVIFRDNSKVFGKPRNTKANSIGFLFNASTAYKLSSHLGIGMEIQYLASGLVSMRSQYHGETIRVDFDESANSSLSRLNINAGLSYYF